MLQVWIAMENKQELVAIKGESEMQEVLNVGSRMFNQYLLKTEEGYLLIDTGYPNGWIKFKKKLAKLNIDVCDITHVFITHAHDDHVGFLGDLIKANSKINIICNPETIERLAEGHNRFIGGATTKQAYIFCKLMALVGKGKHEFPKLHIKKYLWNKDILHEIGINGDIVELRGHTNDQIGILLENGSLFCGDMAMNGFPARKNITIFAENLDDYKKTWDNVIANKCIKTIYPHHGRAFDKTKLKENIKELEKIKLRAL
jgi:glyoxylase-like metal-dependent hydrolase (beta-lactamase superfamily II)